MGGEHWRKAEENYADRRKSSESHYFSENRRLFVRGDIGDPLLHLLHRCADPGGKGEGRKGNFAGKTDEGISVSFIIAFR